MGKVISYYDGFNGSSNYFKIGYVQNENTSVRVFAEKGKGWGVFIPKNIIPKLQEKGEYEKQGEIEGGTFKVSWRLF